MNDQPVYTPDEFEAESRFIDKLIWEAIVIEPGSKVLVCGYGPDGAYVQRAIDAGADVTVIESAESAIRQFAKLDAKLLRGSTSVIGAKDNSFDLAISYHYLHEIDPFFHAQVLAELARVARRVALIEPAPPADPLGKRISVLYSQVKRELGQFEYYQPLEYWKKLLQAVKADVSQHVFAFAKVPPREYLIDTVSLILDTIAVEDAPRQYMDELREIARRSDVALLPPPRFVLVGAAAGELIVPRFTQRVPKRQIAARPAALAAATPPAPVDAPVQAQTAAPGTITPDAGYEFPPVDAPVTPPQTITPEPPPQAPKSTWTAPAPSGFGMPANAPAPGFGVGAPDLPFGAPVPPTRPADAPPAPGQSPFGMPFSMPGAADSAFGLPPESAPPNAQWAWEPPENPEEPPAP